MMSDPPKKESGRLSNTHTHTWHLSGPYVGAHPTWVMG